MAYVIRAQLKSGPSGSGLGPFQLYLLPCFLSATIDLFILRNKGKRLLRLSRFRFDLSFMTCRHNFGLKTIFVTADLEFYFNSDPLLLFLSLASKSFFFNLLLLRLGSSTSSPALGLFMPDEALDSSAKA